MILGWDVGGTKSAAVVGTAAGEIVARTQWDSNAAAGPQAMVDEFFTRAAPLLQGYPGVAAVGVSIGGPMNAATGVIKGPPHLPGWDNIPLAAILQDRLSLPAAIEHDAVTCLLAELLWGDARGLSHAIYLTCGTGMGAGILMNGQIVRGPDGQTPEVGHVRQAEDGPAMFGGKRGCVESFCSGEGIGKLAAFLRPRRFPHATDTRTLHDLAEAGDADARAVLEHAARRTGQLCAMLADIFSPQAILLGSLSRYFGPGWVEMIRREFAAEALADNSRHTRIAPASLGERLQDLSAIAPCVWRAMVAGPPR